MYCSYLTSKAVVFSTADTGIGSVVVEPIAAGETVAAFGGRVGTCADLQRGTIDLGRSSVQIDEALYLIVDDPADGDRINHSCAPTCGLLGGTVVVAMRDLAPGEQLTLDYAMSDGSGYDEFECGCGADTCRGKVTGNDWTLPDLQRRYRGFFSPYLARRIATLAATDAAKRAFAY